jgi:hypothetical protein
MNVMDPPGYAYGSDKAMEKYYRGLYGWNNSFY